MSNGYNYEYLGNLLGENGKNNKNTKNKDKDFQARKIKIINEKKPVDNSNNDKINKENKEPKNNINKKKENGKEIDTPNPDDNKPKSDKSDNYAKLINQILSQKETKLLTDSQYVSFENQIGDNSCYINVIMHFLYIFPCVNDFLIKKYKEQLKEKELKEKEEKETAKEPKEKELEEQKKESQIKTPKEIKETIAKTPQDNKPNKPSKPKEKNKEKEFNDFLFYLGKVLNAYQDILSTNNSKDNITNLNTTQLRKSLSICSDNKFRLNCISDPVEFLIYILELITKENSEEIHLYFHLKLIEEIRCTNFCPVKSNRKYDKDNFIYQIYVEEIFNYIKSQKLVFDDFKENLFMLSYYSSLNEVNICEKCKCVKNKILICNNEDNSPKFLLVNCVWNNARPDLKEVIKFLYFISLVEKLDNLFICPNKTDQSNYYYLIGIIFYSFTLCHYINLIFNLQKNVFTLYNDTGIIEFENIYEVYKYITLEQLKKNDRAYFYPVLLVYCKENIYEEKAFPLLKRINKINYELLLDECDKFNKKEKPKEKPLTEEEKEKNYKELLLAQIKFERNNMNMEKNYNKEDEVYDFLRKERERELNEIRKLNIVDNEQKKIKSNNFLKDNKTNKIVNKSSSVDNKILGQRKDFSNTGNREIYNPYNNRGSNYLNYQQKNIYGHNNYDWRYRHPLGFS